MKKIFIMATILLSGLVVTSCSTNDDEIQKTSTATVATQNEIDYNRNLEGVPKAIIPPRQAPSNDGVDDTTIPPKKP